MSFSLRKSESPSSRFIRSAKRLWASILVVGWCGVDACFGQYSPNPPNDVIYWSKSEFTIPFRIDATGQQPNEVQLETSTNNGATWEIQAKDHPRSRQFKFVSHEDGTYWFRIKTVDAGGRAYDAGGVPLKVVVDTKSPELSLSIDTDERGDMKASFVVRDANPIGSGLRLEYQTEQSQSWTSIQYSTSPPGFTELSGVGTWGIPSGSRQMVVRLIARDAAGNESEVTRLPPVPKTAFGQGNMQLASGAPGSRFAPTYPTPNLAGSPTPPSGIPPSQNKSMLPSKVTPTPVGKPVGMSLPAVNLPPTPKSLPSPSTTTPSSGGYALRRLDDAEAVQPSGSDEVLRLDDGATGQTMKLPDAEGYRTIAGETLDTTPASPTLTEKPFYSSSKAFSLDYEVDSPASAPISAVELWGTTDGGKSWERWGTDPDGVSPFEIKVETEGLFGFRMVIVGANGLAGNRPRNGDNADAWIHVDTEMPTARIHSALYGKGAEAGSLVVEYSAKDAFFGERPIAFSFSELPTGPWTTIASGVRNSGRFVWPADPNLPRRVYLRIEAHDEAGNIAEHKMDVPVDIEGLAPRGRIQGFRPLGN